MHGWDAWNVTEDADLGFRLARHKYRIGTIVSSMLEEAPVHLRAWMNQRRRWLKGWMQTLIVHSRNPLQLVAQVGLIQAAALYSMLFGTVIGALTAPLYVIFMLRLAIAGTDATLAEPLSVLVLLFGSLVCLIGLFSIFWGALLGLSRRRRLADVVWIPLMPLYYLLVSVAAWIAVFDLCFRPYFWSKTEHGLKLPPGGVVHIVPDTPPA